MIDIDDGPLSKIRSSQNARMYSPDNFLCSNSAGTNNLYATTKLQQDDLIACIMDNARKQTEECESMQAFQFYHSLAGGVGSGLENAVQLKLREEYPDKIFANHVVCPSKDIPSNTVEVYNAVLGFQNLIENCDLNFMYDNKSLYEICKSSASYSIIRPSFYDINQILSQQIVNLTASFRFPGTLNSTYQKMATNLVPFPRIHNMTITHSNLRKKSLVKPEYFNMSSAEVLNALFNDSNNLMSVSNLRQKIFGYNLMLRGNFDGFGVHDRLQVMKEDKKGQYYQWINGHAQVGFCDVPPVGCKRSATAVINSTNLVPF